MTINEKIKKYKSEEYDLWRKLYPKAFDLVDSEHTMFCVCGRLASGLHTQHCNAFKKEVEKRTVKLIENNNH